jgi:hypothetical protein
MCSLHRIDQSGGTEKLTSARMSLGSSSTIETTSSDYPNNDERTPRPLRPAELKDPSNKKTWHCSAQVLHLSGLTVVGFNSDPAQHFGDSVDRHPTRNAPIFVFDVL